MISFCSENTFAPSANKLPLPVNLLYASHGVYPKAAEVLQSLKSRSGKDLNRSEKKILKHEFFREVKVYVKAKATGDNETAVKAFLVIVTIAVAVGLTYLLAGLACSLSCSRCNVCLCSSCHDRRFSCAYFWLHFFNQNYHENRQEKANGRLRAV